MSTFIHPTSVIDPGAQIGEGTTIWHFCHIMPTAKIGCNCNLGQNTFIDNHVKIGDRVKIQNNVSVYKGVAIEDNVFIGPSVVFTNVINPRSFIERKTEFRGTTIKTGATIGANSTLVCGITVNEYALIGAGSVVTKDVPRFAKIMGNPARQKGWVSERGLNLDFENWIVAICPESNEKYELKNGQVTKLIE